jgi:putative transposase
MTKAESQDYKSMCRGLLVLNKCLNEMIDSTGNRESIALDSKEKIIEAYKSAQEYLPSKSINKRLGLTGQKLSRWSKEKKCTLSVTKRCFVSNPIQLSLSEQIRLRDYLINPDNSHLPRNHIWAHAKREGLYVSAPTFYKYGRAMCGKPKKVEFEKRESISIRANKSFEILHMDSTRIRCKNGERVYVHFIMDNYSRTILGGVPEHSSKSIVVANNLEAVLIKYKLYNTPLELYCDDGPENKGYLEELIQNDERIKIRKIIATLGV